MQRIATVILIFGLALGYLAGSAVEQSRCRGRIDERVEKFRKANVEMSMVIVRLNRELRLREFASSLPRNRSIEFMPTLLGNNFIWETRDYRDEPAVAEIPFDWAKHADDHRTQQDASDGGSGIDERSDFLSPVLPEARSKR